MSRLAYRPGEVGPLTRLLAWLDENPGTAIGLVLIVLAFGIGLAVAWLSGWVGAPPFRADCPAITRTGACP